MSGGKMKTYMLSEQEIQDLKDLKAVFKKIFKEKFDELSESEKTDLLIGKMEVVPDENEETNPSLTEKIQDKNRS
jgi:hypothetical protein